MKIDWEGRDLKRFSIVNERARIRLSEERKREKERTYFDNFGSLNENSVEERSEGFDRFDGESRLD